MLGLDIRWAWRLDNVWVCGVCLLLVLSVIPNFVFALVRIV